MPVTIVTPDQDTIIGEIDIAAPPSRVWEALVTSDQLAVWWHREEDFHVKSFELDPRKGGKWRYVTFDSSKKYVKPGLTEFIMQGEITEFIPPRLLEMTWSANFHALPWQSTRVRWELSPGGKGTRVKVTHSGLQGLPVDRKEYTEGWPGVLEQLKAFTEK